MILKISHKGKKKGRRRWVLVSLRRFIYLKWEDQLEVSWEIVWLWKEESSTYPKSDFIVFWFLDKIVYNQ